MGRHERVADLARLDSPDLVVADLGSGTGRVVRALLATGAPAFPPTLVHAVDVTSALDDDLLADPRVRARVHDLDDGLPWPDAALDRVTSLNVVEHLADAAAHLREVARVLRPGGLAVVAHSDWDTALFTAADDDLTRRLVDRFVAEVPPFAAHADGFAGRRLPALAARSPLEVVGVDTWADPHTRFDGESVAWKVAMGVAAAAAGNRSLADLAEKWLVELGEAADQGRFLFTVTDVAVVLRR